MKPKIKLSGVIVAMLTPFHDNGDLNLDSLKKLTEDLINAGVHGLFPVSSIGEAAKLSMEEKKTIIRTVVEVTHGRVLVIPGTGFPDERRTIDLTSYARDVGADAALIVEPYYQKPSSEALYDYYKKINDSFEDFPLLLYNIPVFSGYELSPELVAKCADLSNFVGIKDSGGDISKLNLMIHLTRGKMAVLQGIDMLFLPSLIVGSQGGMMGGGNLAAEMEVELYNSFMNGDIKRAQSIHERLLPLWSTLSAYGTGPGPYKEALSLTGTYAGPARRPAQALTAVQKKQLKRTLIQAGLLRG